MALIRNKEIIGWDRAAAAELRRRRNVDDAAPVGSKKLRPKEHTATEIKRNDCGRLIYGAEVPLEVYRDEVSLAPDVALLAGLSSFTGWLFQVRGREAAEKYAGATVVLAKYPPSKNYVVIGHLKPTTKDQTRGMERHLKPALAAVDLAQEPADVRLAQAMSRLNYTPFTNAYPALAAWGLPKESSAHIGAERRDGDDNYVVGILPLPLHETIEALKSDPILERCIDLTESGQLFGRAKNDGEKDRGPVRKQVVQDIIDNRHKILDFAIRVSFAGFINPWSVAGWHVARWTAMVYHRFAYAAQSRIEDRKDSEPNYVPFPSDRITLEEAGEAGWERKLERDERLYKALGDPEGKAAKAVRAVLVQAQTDPDEFHELLNSIKWFAGARPVAWVKELIQEFDRRQASLSRRREGQSG